ncbi:MAG: c-type cytochrome [Candidatus Zixiibacteriota bacterium]|nr:MAG: c-type cytochrome [candidate division Zixibacteria bacterium]
MKTHSLFFSFIVLSFLAVGCSDDKSTTPTTPKAYDDASLSKGGIMYDKFWSTEAAFNQNDPNLATYNAKSDFFRCKQCHGWDLLGRSGSYIGRGPKTTRPNVSVLNLYQLAKTKTPQELFDGLKKSANRRDVSYDLSTYDPTTNSTVGDQMPNFSQILTDAQIWDVVKFLREGAFDVAQLYDATYSGTYPTGTAAFANLGKDGNAAAGMTYFSSNCVACHGPTGVLIELEGMTLGAFARSKSNEVQHKVKYGTLGSDPIMTGKFDITLSQMKDLYKALADTSAFPTAFPSN